MATKVKSQKCDLSSCQNQVRMDNPTFPYCRHHQGLKTIESKFSSESSTYTIEESREILYAPKNTHRSPKDMAMDIMTDTQGDIAGQIIAMVYPKWKEAVDGKDMIDPKESREHRDGVIDEVRVEIDSHSEYTTDTVTCHGGIMMNSDGESVPVDDHRVIMAESKDGTKIIIDVASAAPLASDPSQLDGFESGETSFQDGLKIMHMFEYCAYDSVEYSEFRSESTNKVLWRVEVKGSDSPESRAQRELVKQYGLPYGHGRRSQGENNERKQSSGGTDSMNNDQTLDEMLDSMSGSGDNQEDR